MLPVYLRPQDRHVGRLVDTVKVRIPNVQCRTA